MRKKAKWSTGTYLLLGGRPEITNTNAQLRNGDRQGPNTTPASRVRLLRGGLRVRAGNTAQPSPMSTIDSGASAKTSQPHLTTSPPCATLGGAIRPSHGCASEVGGVRDKRPSGLSPIGRVGLG